MKALITIAFTVALAGCGSNPIAPVIDDKIQVDDMGISHPQRPLPVQKVIVKWHLSKNNDYVKLSLSYNDAIEFRKFLEDMKRYILEQQKMLCFYRKSLNEPMCEKGINDDKADE